MNHVSQSGAAKTRVSVMLSLGNSQDGLCTRSSVLYLSFCTAIIYPAPSSIQCQRFDDSAKAIIIIEIRFQSYT